METFTRRLEIINILVYRRSEKIDVLARELGVCSRTIQTDICYLSAIYPVVTVRGRYGCVKLIEGYHPYRRTLTLEQKSLFQRIMNDVALNEREKIILSQFIEERG